MVFDGGSVPCHPLLQLQDQGCALNMQAQDELVAAREQLHEQGAAAAAAAANVDMLRQRCARLEAELAQAHAAGVLQPPG